MFWKGNLRLAHHYPVSLRREWRSQAMKLHMKEEITMKVMYFLAGLSLARFFYHQC
jgi:hypothetical protein